MKITWSVRPSGSYHPDVSRPLLVARCCLFAGRCTPEVSRSCGSGWRPASRSCGQQALVAAASRSCGQQAGTRESRRVGAARRPPPMQLAASAVQIRRVPAGRVCTGRPISLGRDPAAREIRSWPGRTDAHRAAGRASGAIDRASQMEIQAHPGPPEPFLGPSARTRTGQTVEARTDAHGTQPSRTARGICAVYCSIGRLEESTARACVL